MAHMALGMSGILAAAVLAAPTPAPTQGTLEALSRSSWLAADLRRQALDGAGALAARNWQGAWTINESLWLKMPAGFLAGQSSPVISIRIEGSESSDPDPEIDVWTWRLERSQLALLVGSPVTAEKLAMEVRQARKDRVAEASRAVADAWIRQGRYGEALSMIQSSSTAREGEESMLALAASGGPIAQMQLAELAERSAIRASGPARLPDIGGAAAPPQGRLAAEAALILAEMALKEGRKDDARRRLSLVLSSQGQESYWLRVIALQRRAAVETSGGSGI